MLVSDWFPYGESAFVFDGNSLPVSGWRYGFHSDHRVTDQRIEMPFDYPAPTP